MRFSILATLALAFAAPIASSSCTHSNGTHPVNCTKPATALPKENSNLQPLIYVGKDGSLWIGDEARQKLINTDAMNVVGELAAITRRAVDPKIHFCCFKDKGCCCEDDSCEDSCEDPCAPPPPSCDPCADSCDPCCEDDSDCCCSDGNCRDELRASCYTKWFCPSTYCCKSNNRCNDNHPVVDGLRSCCATKWLCPSTYCPSNWCCNDGSSGCCCDNSDDSCDNSCEPCDPCDPCSPCYDPCAPCCDQTYEPCDPCDPCSPCYDPCAPCCQEEKKGCCCSSNSNSGDCCLKGALCHC